MKIKQQLTIFNAITRSLVIVILWFLLAFIVKDVVYRHMNKSLLEKKQKFIKHLDKEEINNFLISKDTSKTYASFSTLHSEFILLSRLPMNSAINKTVIINEPRIIEEEKNDYRILQYNFLYENLPYQLEIGNSLSETEDLIFVIRFFVLIVLIIILIITFLIDVFYLEYLFKPFYKIIDTKIRHVNLPDSFDPTPIVSHSSDFQELDSVLNLMMNRIFDLFKKEKQFIANVSHELLTPIALLKNKFENLLQNNSLDNEAIDKVAASLRTLDMLKKIINNLLLISRIDNNQYVANESINLQERIEDLQEDLRDRIEEKEIVFKSNVTNSYAFCGNKTLMHILLYNLVVNAIKYNKSKGSISIEDEFVKGRYVLLIIDTGIGMDDGSKQNIFNRFSRINSDQDGQGLGLAIVESIAHFHHIKIEVSSVAGHGTTFQLLFPMQQA
jgi:signal transduction histidine kinase